jgi:hypothetical protein
LHNHKQLTIFDICGDFQSATSKDKFKMLTDYVDIEELIHLDVKLS